MTTCVVSSGGDADELAQQALDAQAVAARSYAVASRWSAPTSDVYDNTRSPDV